jgi:type I restriction enzyme S subunit
MSDLPPGWSHATIGDLLLRIEAGRSFRCEPRPASLSEWGIIKVSAMTWGAFREEENKAVPAGIDFNPDYEIRPGDILVSRANTEDYVGAPVLVDRCRPHLLLSDKSLRLVPSGHLNFRWLYYLLSSQTVRREISRRATGTKDSMRNVSQETLVSIQVQVPPLAEQDRIVTALDDHLSRLEHAESILSGIVARLSSLYRAILKKKFREISLGSASHIRKLGNVAIVANGQTPHGISESLFTETGADCVPFYKVGDMNNSDGRFMSSSRTYIHRDDAARLGLKIRPAGTVLIPKRGGAIATNKKRILRTPSAYDLNTMGIIPSPDVDSTYLWRWFEQINLAELSDGSNVPQLNNPDLINLEISVPDLTVQQDLTKELDILTTGITRLLRTVNESRKSQLRSMLLKEAFAGRLVPQNPTDEPSAVLLNRIHAERVTQSQPRRRRRAANPILQEETQL